MKIETYKQAKEYLNSFVNYEKKVNFPYQKSLKLERVYFLLDSLRIDYQALKVIHIAGTKGKGSTAQFCASLLATTGKKIGLYTSPHFFDFRERIQIVHSPQSIAHSRQPAVNSHMIGKKDVVRITGEIRRKLAKLKVQENLGSFSFFEIYTAIAFKYFLEKGVDFVVFETGLGGRLDATNVVKPLASIITHIGYDHVDKLGKRLSDIAAQKGGIIKPGAPVICSSQRPTALEMIRRKAKENSSPFFLLGKDIKVRNVRLKNKNTNFDFSFKGLKLNKLKINLKGRHQVDNVCLALAAVILLKEKGLIENKFQWNQALRSCYLGGRFEVINKAPLTVVDIAHNVSSFWALKSNLKEYFPGKKIILIFSCAKDKDARNMLKQVDYSYLILTSFSNPRSWEPYDLRKKLNLKETFIAKSIKEAYKQAKRIYNKDSLIVISGSFFLVSEAKKLIRTKVKA